jgi:hypothetical protein
VQIGKISPPVMDIMAMFAYLLERSNLYGDHLVRLAIQVGYGNHGTQHT